MRLSIPARLLLSLLWVCATLRADAGAPQKITDLEGVWVADFNQDASTIIVQMRNGTLGLWDTEKGTPLTSDLGKHTLEGRYVISDDGSLALVDPKDGKPRVYDLTTGKVLTPELRADLAPSIRPAACFSPDGSQLIIPESSGSIRIFELPSGTLRKTLKLSPTNPDREDSIGLAFSSDGRTALIMDGTASLRRYRTETWEPVGQAMRHPHEDAYHYGFTISEDARYAVTSDWPGENGPIGKMQLWDTTTSKPLGEPLSAVNGIGGRFLDEGKLLLIQPSRGTTRIARVPSLETTVELPRHDDVDASRGTPVANGTKLISHGYDAKVLLIDVATGKYLGVHSTKAHLQTVLTGPDPRYAWLVYDNTAFTPQGQHDHYIIKFGLEKIEPHTNRTLRPMATARILKFLHRTTLSQDGTRLMVHEGGSGKERIRLFETNTLKELPSTAAPD